MSAVDSTASATRAYALPTMPATSFAIARSVLTRIPSCAERTPRSFVGLLRAGVETDGARRPSAAISCERRLGAYGVAGFRYRWATGEPSPMAPWQGSFIP